MCIMAILNIHFPRLFYFAGERGWGMENSWYWLRFRLNLTLYWGSSLSVRLIQTFVVFSYFLLKSQIFFAIGNCLPRFHMIDRQIDRHFFLFPKFLFAFYCPFLIPCALCNFLKIFFENKKVLQTHTARDAFLAIFFAFFESHFWFYISPYQLFWPLDQGESGLNSVMVAALLILCWRQMNSFIMIWVFFCESVRFLDSHPGEVCSAGQPAFMSVFPTDFCPLRQTPKSRFWMPFLWPVTQCVATRMEALTVPITVHRTLGKTSTETWFGVGECQEASNTNWTGAEVHFLDFA